MGFATTTSFDEDEVVEVGIGDVGAEVEPVMNELSESEGLNFGKPAPSPEGLEVLMVGFEVGSWSELKWANGR